MSANKMKKLNPRGLRGVFDGFRSSVSTPPKTECDVEETLRSEHFQVAKTVRHGFPSQPTAMAYDPVQNILAIGTRTGSVRLLGTPGVDCHVKHDGDHAVIQVLFLINEGAMVTACTDDQLHLWTLRQKRPEIVHSLRFQRERITYCHLPFQSKWLYVGTERGNVHIVNIEKFVLSGYVINWNKAIEISRKTHPGPVVHLSDSPMDPNKMVIGFECGEIVMWDLKTKTAECRFFCPETLKSVAWHHEGKQLMCSHSNGSLTTWNVQRPQKPHAIMMPHAKLGKDGKPEPCRPISKVEWMSTRTGEPYVIFSGGMPYERGGSAPCLTVMHGKSTTVLEMEHPVEDFITLSESPYNNDFQDPYGIVVLLQNDLVVVDLTTPGYPCFENPYPMDLHESPVTSCCYMANCAPDLIPAFYSVGSKQKKTGFSEKNWPVKGGMCGQPTTSYYEMIITGHADGSLKFWDASAVTLVMLYKLKTAKLFDKSRCHQPDSDDDPYAVQLIHLCSESRLLVVCGLTHVLIFRFSRQDNTVDVPVLEVSIVYEIYDDLDSPGLEYPPAPHKDSSSGLSQPSGSVGSYTSDGKESQCSVAVRQGAKKWSSGYQPELCCLLTWIDGEPPPPVTSISLNSSYGLLAFGNECGIAVVDIIQKTCILSMGTPDIYGTCDPYSRAPRSPKNKNQTSGSQVLDNVMQAGVNDECKSPTTDQPPDHVDGEAFARGTKHTAPHRPSNNRQTSPHNLKSIQELPGSSMQPNPVEGSGVGGTTRSVEGDVEEVGSEASELLLEECVSTRSNTPVTTEEEEGGHTEGMQPRDSAGEDASSEALSNTTAKKAVSKTVSAPVAEQPHADEVIHPRRHVSDTSAPTREKSKKKSNFFQRLRHGSGPFVVDHSDADDSVPPESEAAHPTDLTLTAITRSFKSETDLKTSKWPGLVLDINSAKFHECSDGVDGVAVPQTAPVAHHSRGVGFMRKMSQKIRATYKRDENENVERKRPPRFEVMELAADDVLLRPPCKKFTYTSLLEYLHEKGEGSFSRSRSSSMSSLENISKEAITTLVFADGFVHKTDCMTCPGLWVGTSLGSVLVISLNLPDGDARRTEPVIVSPSGTIFRLKGVILTLSFLDCNGILLPAATDQWRDSNNDSQREAPPPRKDYRRQQSMSSIKARMSPTSSTDIPSDRQYSIMCSDKQARVVSLPSQTCVYKVKITDTSCVVKAEVTSMKDSVCLTCFIANGHLMTFSLPSLKPLLDIDFMPEVDERVVKTFSFSNNGTALYLCSPSEVQKLTVSAETCVNLAENLGELFLPCDTPDAPKQSFFKNLFGGGTSNLDREELFGEGSGKASKGVAKYTAGMANMQERAGGACSEIAKAKMAALERGEKLGELEDRTAQMRQDAEVYASTAHQLMQKYQKKKWYQL